MDPLIDLAIKYMPLHIGHCNGISTNASKANKYLMGAA